jgi:hypothetical protein
MYYPTSGVYMCNPSRFDSLVRLIHTVNSELSALPFKERVERAREALANIYKYFCVEDGYIKVIMNIRGEKHVTRVEVAIDYTTPFRPLLVIRYPYLQLPRK